MDKKLIPELIRQCFNLDIEPLQGSVCFDADPRVAPAAIYIAPRWDAAGKAIADLEWWNFEILLMDLT